MGGALSQEEIDALLKGAYMKMNNIVVTAYGHGKTIDKIAVSLFEGNSWHYGQPSPDAATYCNTINSLELKDNSWVFAKIISENAQYDLDVFLPIKFSSVIAKLDDRAIQKVLREVNTYDIANSLDGEDETVREKIFSNMTKRAAQMLKEDMRCMGPARLRSVKESQDKILSLIQLMTQTGEIITEGGNK